MINSEKTRQEFLENGYIVFPEFYKIEEEHLKIADEIMKDYAYKIGRRHVSSQINSIPGPLKDLIYSEELVKFFNSFYDQKLNCNDIMVTNEFYHDKMERNKWLHFDRWKSLKAMVYLSDVCPDSGPFSVVPGTHKIGANLRRAFKGMPYEHRPNRIEIDYPSLYKESTPICEKKGTLILFDSDIFHQGGSIKEGKTRTLIRSHWYANRSWQVGA